MNRIVNQNLALILTAGMCLALGAPAFAQQNPPPRGERGGAGGGDPAMGGPRVPDRRVPGVEGQFGEGGDRKRMGAQQKLPPKVFRDALDAVLSPEASDDLRVSDEQREKFEGWFQDFQKSSRTYMSDYRAELGELRKEGGEFNRPKRPGQPPQPPQDEARGERDDAMRPDGGGADQKSATEARERMKALMDGAPKVEDVYTRVWTELNPRQRQAVDARLDEFRADQSRQREENYVRQKLNKKNPPPQGQPGPDGAPRGGPKNPQQDSPFGRARPPVGPAGDEAQGPGRINITPERRDRLLRILNRMTPEQQDQLIQRLEQRLQQEAGQGGSQPQGPGAGPPQRRGPGRQGGPKASPPMDEVNVPPAPPPPPSQREDQP